MLAALYHEFVRRKILSLFNSVGRGDAEPLLNQFAPRFEHASVGNHALGGSRHGLAATRDWYSRLYRLLPEIAFTIEKLEVRGMPWNTMAVIEWIEVNSGADGIIAASRGIHVVWIRWGRVTRLLIVPETDKLLATLDRLAAKGFAEAKAAAIAD